MQFGHYDDYVSCYCSAQLIRVNYYLCLGVYVHCNKYRLSYMIYVQFGHFDDYVFYDIVLPCLYIIYLYFALALIDVGVINTGRL